LKNLKINKNSAYFWEKWNINFSLLKTINQIFIKFT
jgi:hypothetical protein